jgi:hypothetical protein
MYELIIGAYQDFEKDFKFIQSDYIPRTEEIIDNYKVDVCDENDNITTFVQKLEVQSVHYKLFEDNSCMPIVYANVIKCEKLEKEVS